MSISEMYRVTRLVPVGLDGWNMSVSGASLAVLHLALTVHIDSRFTADRIDMGNLANKN